MVISLHSVGATTGGGDRANLKRGQKKRGSGLTGRKAAFWTREKTCPEAHEAGTKAQRQKKRKDLQGPRGWNPCGGKRAKGKWVPAHGGGKRQSPPDP